MKIVRATEMGMCFGVRDALQITREVSDPTQVTVHGELVHNPAVINQLSAAGFAQAAEDDRQSLPDRPVVLITAHGVSNRERSRLQNQGKQLIDTTCPLVRRVHDAAFELASQDRHVLLIGKSGHVEVLGIVDDLESYDVISSAQQVQAYGHQRLGVICQTTMPTAVVDQIRLQIETLNPAADIRFVDTVCHPTKRRQQAMLDLLGRVDAVVVVGGRNSNNTQRLVTLCEQRSVPALHVTCSDEIDPDWFSDVQTVGLTAGTSTLDETIDDVERRLQEIAACESVTG
ncbi:4-hydroxy-3-methylbut-2-enyl diphosphate reductase [Stieleria bergensis]|uniref:4-hydroxy-3-methylbut-2-enyl diphosphate reductase n=1 Tax=Stieleria bergensis TaxID=2528025 RepID=A0A517T2P1_9BACT|nr:4-hydroxy-3-methylbut-2-enyl diphosphate reductase [Planctomycetes bacterium SV_7m_r]